MKRADLIEGVSYAHRAGYTGGDDRYLNHAELVSKERWEKPERWSPDKGGRVTKDGKHVKMVSRNGSMRRTIFILPRQIVRTSALQKDFEDRMDKVVAEVRRKEDEELAAAELAVQRFQDALKAHGIPLPKPEVVRSKFHKKIRIELSLDEIGLATTWLENMSGGWG